MGKKNQAKIAMPVTLTQANARLYLQAVKPTRMYFVRFSGLKWKTCSHKLF